MKFSNKEKGQALVLVLFFSLIATLLVVAVLYMVLRGTSMSGMQKRYQTSLDAAYAGVTVETAFLQKGINYQIDAPIFTTYPPAIPPVAAPLTINPAAGTCFFNKVYTPYPWAGPCGVSDASVDPKTSPDAKFVVLGANHTTYTVFAKVIDSRSGITTQRPPGGLSEANGAAYGKENGLNLTQQAYFYYAVQVASNDPSKKSETAGVSFDYAW